jgi:hypothetical protein
MAFFLLILCTLLNNNLSAAVFFCKTSFAGNIVGYGRFNVTQGVVSFASGTSFLLLLKKPNYTTVISIEKKKGKV